MLLVSQEITPFKGFARSRIVIKYRRISGTLWDKNTDLIVQTCKHVEQLL